MENWKNDCSSPKTCSRAKLPITDPPKVWVSGFMSVDGNEKVVSAIMKNGKNSSRSPKTHPRAKLPNYQPPKVWLGLQFSECQYKQIISVGHYEKWL